MARHNSIAQPVSSDRFLAFVRLYLEFAKGRSVRSAQASLRGSIQTEVDMTLALPEKPWRDVPNLRHEVLAAG